VQELEDERGREVEFMHGEWRGWRRSVVARDEHGRGEVRVGTAQTHRGPMDLVRDR
jgi:hypothetical protein